MRAGCTIAAKGEWALARVTAASFAEHHPGVPFFVLLADEPEGCSDPALEPFEVIPLGALDVPRQTLFRYDRQALSYALTPSLIELLLDRGFSQVMFVKQESLVLGELPFDALGSIALTPHLLEPIGAEEELPILLAGAYNGGLVGVADRPQGRAFLRWWADRLREHCVHDPARALHFEQRWLDLVPAFFDEAVLIRDPGCNIGHWNVHQRDVAGASLVRFSGYDMDEPELVSRYRDLRVDELGPFAAAWRDYHRRLVAAGGVDPSYAYDRFANGAPIPPVAREMPLWGDPFGDEFYGWLSDGDPVPRLWEFVRQRRPDLRRGFADDDEGFLAWVATHGAEEYGRLR